MATNVSKTFKRTFASTAIRNQLKDVVIVGAARTPMGSFRGYDLLCTLRNYKYILFILKLHFS